MATTMITGGTGFIASHLARRLLAAGDKVVLFDFQPDREQIKDIAADVTVARGDITVFAELIGAIKANGVERIAHLAYVLGSDSEPYPLRAVQVNCLGTSQVFEAARLEGLQRVVWTSTAAVFGRESGHGGTESLDEDDDTNPTNVYGACKVFNEYMADHYFRRFGLEHIGLRPANVYGPGHLRGSLQYITEWVEQAAAGNHVVIEGGDEWDNWSYVDDVARALTMALQTPQLPPRRVFNIGGDYRTKREFGLHLQKLTPNAQIEILDGMAHAHRPRFRNSNIAEALGFRPEWPMERGLEATVDWAKQKVGRNS